MDKRDKFRSFFQALFLSSNLIAYTIDYYDFNKIIYAVSLFFLVISTRKILLTYPIILAFILTFILCLASIYLWDYPLGKSYLFYFIIFSLFSLISLSERIDFSRFYKLQNFILLLCVPVVISSFVKEYDIGILLGISYSILPNYICSLILIDDTNDFTTKKIISLINIVIFGVFFILKGNRGVILCLLLFFVLKFIFNGKGKKIGSLMKVVVLSILGGIATINIITILETISNFFRKTGIHIYAIDKTINLALENRDIDSGRGFLLQKLMTTINTEMQIVFGRGIGFFENTFGVYTHNLFLQYFVEGGVFYCLIPVILFIILIKKIFVSKESEINFYIFLISSTFIPLLLSNVYWVNPLYWLGIYYIFYSISKQRLIIKF